MECPSSCMTFDSALLQRRSVRVRIMGELDMLPDDVQEILAKAAWDSRNNTKYSRCDDTTTTTTLTLARAVLNIAVAYTSRDEMLRAMNLLAKGVDNGAITVEYANHVWTFIV